MPYEVVDPAHRDKDGPIYPDLTSAMIGAGPSLEVWELSDGLAATRMVRCWPDDEFQPASDVERARRARTVREHVGRAEREAAAIYSAFPAQSPAAIQGVIAYAWAQGYLAGYGECAKTADDAFRALSGDEPR